MNPEEPAAPITDPRAIRALAHPTRLRLLGELRARGPQNVGGLSELLDESPGSISYHVRALAKHGFVEEAPELARTGRETWWRARHARTVWDPASLSESPELRLAASSLERAVLTRWYEKLATYLDNEPLLDRAWVESAVSTDAVLHLTVDELAELRDELRELVGRWQAKSNADRDTAAQVTLLYHAFRSDT